MRSPSPTHPETRDGEVFFCNSDDQTFQGIGYKTKRAGNTAYDIHGKIVPEIFPVFVQRQELETAGVNPDNPFGDLL